MTNRLSTALIAGIVAGSMFATAALALPAPGNTSLSTTPSELREVVKTTPAVEKPVQVQPAKSVTVNKPVKAKKQAKKGKGKKAKAAPKAAEANSSTGK